MKITKQELTNIIETVVRKKINVHLDESIELNIVDLAKYIQTKTNTKTNVSNTSKAYQYVLGEYKKLCDQLDFDYEFNYIDDIKNNTGSIGELKSFFKKYMNNKKLNEGFAEHTFSNGYEEIMIHNQRDKIIGMYTYKEDVDGIVESLPKFTKWVKGRNPVFVHYTDYNKYSFSKMKQYLNRNGFYDNTQS